MSPTSWIISPHRLHEHSHYLLTGVHSSRSRDASAHTMRRQASMRLWYRLTDKYLRCDNEAVARGPRHVRRHRGKTSCRDLSAQWDRGDCTLRESSWPGGRLGRLGRGKEVAVAAARSTCENNSLCMDSELSGCTSADPADINKIAFHRVFAMLKV